MDRLLQVVVLLVILPLGGLAAARTYQGPQDRRTLSALASSGAETLAGRLRQPWVLGLLAAGSVGVAAGALWRRSSRPVRASDSEEERAAPQSPHPDRVEALGLLLWVGAVGGASAQAAWMETRHASSEAVAYAAPIVAGPRGDGAVRLTRKLGAGTPAYFDSPSGTVQVERDGQVLGETPLSLDALCTPGQDVALRFTQPRRQPATWAARCEDGAMFLFTLELLKAR